MQTVVGSRKTPLIASLLLLVAWASAQAQDGNWSALAASAPAPGPRREFVAVYDDLNGRYLIFGGLAGTMPYYQLTNQVWALTLQPTPAWSQLSVAGDPPGRRASAQYGYDPTRHRVLVFGGYGSHYPGDPDAYLNDVWELSLEGVPTWTELHPSGIPPQGRLAGAAVYDPLRQRFVGFGGTRGLPVDTWELELSDEPPKWSTVHTSGNSPPGSYGMASIYDSSSDQMIIFGGSTSDDYYGCHNNTWALNLHGQTPTWHQLNPGGPLPTGRRTMASIYDPLRDRMIIYGGWDGASNNLSSFLGDTWALSLHGALQWTQLGPGGTQPPNRDATAAIYDPSADRMVFLGGWSGVEFLGDTRFLTWGGSGRPGSASADAQADPDAAHLTWSLSNATGEYVGVYRRGAGQPWSSLGDAIADASGQVAYDDYAVVAGQSYEYAVVMSSERGPEVQGQTQVDVPVPTDFDPGTNLTFGVSSIYPNPVMSRFTISLALASSAPARLDVFDVRGRRIASRELGNLGPGPRMLEMDRGNWGSGVYYVRLSQSGRVHQSRMVVLEGAARVYAH